jgi:uncharacterized membrane protein YdjX (TVP38/TMEM64 family)
MSSDGRRWPQRAAVVLLWLGVFVAWWNYRTSNDLSTLEAAQRFVDAIDDVWWGILAFVGVYLVRPLVLFPASVLTVIAGVVFGPLTGVLVVIVAANTSALVVYGVGRSLGRAPDDDSSLDIEAASFVHRWASRLRDNSFETVFVMRLIFLPYDLVNYLCGTLRIRWTSFLLATALGSLPGTISFVLAGASLERIDDGIDGIDPFAVVSSIAIFLVSLAVSRVVERRQGTQPVFADPVASDDAHVRASHVRASHVPANPLDVTEPA